MKEGLFDGVILAVAGLKRLGALDDPPRGGQGLSALGMVSLLPLEVCLPAVGQGALAIETRAVDPETQSRVSVLNDSKTAAETLAERAFLEALGGGCRVPVAALGAISSGRLGLRGVVASLDGTRLIRVEGEESPDRAAELGRRLAEEAIRSGAAELLGES
jgi:hydroxymethylbilane synthase